MKVSFEGIGDQIVSFVKGSGAEKGVFVKLGASSTVAAADDGGDGFGVRDFPVGSSHDSPSCNFCLELAAL